MVFAHCTVTGGMKDEGGSLAGQNKEPKSAVCGAAPQTGHYGAMSTNLPMYSGGKKEKETPQPSTYEKDEKKLLFC